VVQTLAGFLVLAASGCDGGSSGPAAPSRSFRMGFAEFPPRPDPALVLPTLEVWTQRADAGLVQLGIPWGVLLGGTEAREEVRQVRLPLANYYRGKGLTVAVTLDVTDGLDRRREAPELVALGRSITDTAVQRLYREYVAAVDTIIRPDYLSLAAETNLIRLAAPDSVYQAVVAMTNQAWAERHADGSAARFMISVQVEVAWNRLGGPPGPYLGIGVDRTDFPFADALGLSSYPYLAGFEDPDHLPADYYSRLMEGDSLPMVVLEGGWSSRTVGATTSSPAEQARYLERQSELLNRARAAIVFQITFTDLEVGAWPVGVEPFAYLGLVDSAFTPKPALATWDSIFGLSLSP
jgi:hypothetical protein